MKVDLTKKIIGLDGKPIAGVKEAFIVIRDSNTGREDFMKDEKGNDVTIVRDTPKEAITLKTHLISSLLFDPKGAIPVEEKVKRYALFFRIENAKNNTIDLEAEEIALCKKCNNEYANILAAGRVNSLLEGK